MGTIHMPALLLMDTKEIIVMVSLVHASVSSRNAIHVFVTTVAV